MRLTGAGIAIAITVTGTAYAYLRWRPVESIPARSYSSPKQSADPDQGWEDAPSNSGAPPDTGWEDAPTNNSQPGSIPGVFRNLACCSRWDLWRLTESPGCNPQLLPGYLLCQSGH